MFNGIAQFLSSFFNPSTNNNYGGGINDLFQSMNPSDPAADADFESQIQQYQQQQLEQQRFRDISRGSLG